MASKPKYLHPDKLTTYEEIVKTIPGLQRKGAANPYTSLNGHMFSFLDKEGKMSLRLPKDELNKFLEEHHTELSFQYNTVMKEYAIIPDQLFENAAEQLARYFKMSYYYVGSLKPNPSRRK